MIITVKYVRCKSYYPRHYCCHCYKSNQKKFECAPWPLLYKSNQKNKLYIHRGYCYITATKQINCIYTVAIPSTDWAFYVTKNSNNTQILSGLKCKQTHKKIKQKSIFISFEFQQKVSSPYFRFPVEKHYLNSGSNMQLDSIRHATIKHMQSPI